MESQGEDGGIKEICGSGRCVHSDKQSGLEVKEAHLEGKAMLLGLYKLGL